MSHLILHIAAEKVRKKWEEEKEGKTSDEAFKGSGEKEGNKARARCLHIPLVSVLT